MQYPASLVLIGAVLMILSSVSIYVFIISDILKDVFAKGTYQNTIWTNVYFENRPFVMPSLCIQTVQDILTHENWKWIAFDVAIICYWSWRLKHDDDDDRWNRRGRKLKRKAQSLLPHPPPKPAVEYR